MSPTTQKELLELRASADRGDLVACDALAGHLYDEARHEESASLYLRAFLGGYYDRNSHPDSERKMLSLVDNGLISRSSDLSRVVRQRRDHVESLTQRAHKAAGAAGIAVFIGYTVLVYIGGITGFLRDFSLIIGGVLAWGTWKLVLSSFDSGA